MEVVKLLLDRGTTRLASLILGDPPLYIDLNTPSQESAAIHLGNNPIGKRIAKDCFFDFETANPASGSQSIYLNRLVELAKIIPIHLSTVFCHGITAMMEAVIAEHFFPLTILTSRSKKVPKLISMPSAMPAILSFIRNRASINLSIALHDKIHEIFVLKNKLSWGIYELLINKQWDTLKPLIADSSQTQTVVKS
jgi:hypothetical protein